MITANTARLLIPVSNSTSNIAAGFTNTSVTLWDQNKEDGKYIIGYEINDGLDQDTKELIPKVSHSL